MFLSFRKKYNYNFPIKLLFNSDKNFINLILNVIKHYSIHFIIRSFNHKIIITNRNLTKIYNIVKSKNHHWYIFSLMDMEILEDA